MDKDDKKEQLVRDYNEVFGSPQGNRVWENLCNLAHYKVVRIPKDSLGRIDSSAVLVDVGTRKLMVHIDTMLKKGNPNEA